jgi:hypothetical protein
MNPQMHLSPISPPAPEYAVSTTAIGGAPRWRPGFNGYGLAVTVIVHLILLVAVLSWRSRVPPPKPRNPDLIIMLPQQQPKIPEPMPPLPKPELAPPSLPAVPEPPPVVVTEVQPAPQVAPPVVAPPAASPAPAPAPAATGTVSAAARAAPAASAVGSTRLVEDCADAPDRKMVAEVYRLSSRTTSVKEMNRRKPLRTVCLTQLNFAPRHMGLGLPALDLSEWYGLDIRFTVNVPQDGSRDFVLLSDDGATFSVDDVEVVNNDGLHTPDAVMGTVTLSRGIHHLRVRYFQGPGDGALMLGWKKTGEADYQPIPQRLLGRPTAAASAAE